ncbi:MAG: hypothetical protein U1E51_03060 [Candidatus Binatia bacterium]|nr:hypothetical protein [Candidatus Binatia bacterium]
MNSGVPPTPFHARTGLLTPPGILAFARRKSLRERFIAISGVHLPLGMQAVKAIDKKKNAFSEFFSCKEIQKLIKYFFRASLVSFVSFFPAGIDLYEK